jgi:hypothetical protein
VSPGHLPLGSTSFCKHLPSAFFLVGSSLILKPFKALLVRAALKVAGLKAAAIAKRRAKTKTLENISLRLDKYREIYEASFACCRL